LPHKEFIAQLRGIAVLMVVVMHCPAAPPALAAFPFLASGYYGVALFFAISGFLITNNILGRYGSVAAINLREFYIMRAGRILPCLALLLALLSILSLMKIPVFVFPATSSLSGAIWHVATLSFNAYQKAGADAPPGWAILWSLSIEAAFYVLFPITAIILRSEKLLIAALLVVIANGLRERTYHADLLSYSGGFDLIDMGALAAIGAHRLSPPKFLLRPIKWAGALVCFGTYVFLPINGHETIGPFLMAFGAAAMLFASKFEAPIPVFRPLALSGECSYEIYLFHNSIFLLSTSTLAATFGVGSFAGFVLSMLTVLVFAIVLRQSFSQPMNRLIRSTTTKPLLFSAAVGK
jgi:peptidoglycan/LPS O-acetylase OafA/YrhL